MAEKIRAMRPDRWDGHNPYDLFPELAEHDFLGEEEPVYAGPSMEELIADGEALQTLLMEADILVMLGAPKKGHL